MNSKDKRCLWDDRIKCKLTLSAKTLTDYGAACSKARSEGICKKYPPKVKLCKCEYHLKDDNLKLNLTS